MKANASKRWSLVFLCVLLVGAAQPAAAAFRNWHVTVDRIGIDNKGRSWIRVSTVARTGTNVLSNHPWRLPADTVREMMAMAIAARTNNHKLVIRGDGDKKNSEILNMFLDGPVPAAE